MPENAQRIISYGAAVKEGIDQAMASDENVIVIGEGVPDPKAIFGTTAGLFEKYGSKRVFDMPLAENGMTGICIGAAMSGMRPILVHQRIDFSLLSMDQLVNNAAKWHYMFDGKARIPLVVRMIIGRGWGQGPQHSQGLHAMFAQVPGLKVVMPSTPYDAKGLLITAIEDDNPTIFIEHRWLHQVADHVPMHYYQVPFSQARVLQEGDGVTVAAFSYAALESLQGARALYSNMGLQVEVVDMRSVRPLDVDSIVRSVRKTSRLLVVDVAFETGSIAGELIYRVTHEAFGSLSAAPSRLTLPDFPVPTSHFMTDGYYPGPQQIADAVLDLLSVARSGSGYENLREELKIKGRHDIPHRDFTGPF